MWMWGLEMPGQPISWRIWYSDLTVFENFLVPDVAPAEHEFQEYDQAYCATRANKLFVDVSFGVGALCEPNQFLASN